MHTETRKRTTTIKPVSTRLDPALWHSLKVAAVKSDMTVSQIMDEAVRSIVAKYDR
jgi:predicted DNA-binding ribbon-helix-helix protein